MTTTYSEFAEFYKSATRGIYEEYIINQEKSRHSAGTPLAAQEKVQAKYSADERKCQDGHETSIV